MMLEEVMLMQAVVLLDKLIDLLCLEVMPPQGIIGSDYSTSPRTQTNKAGWSLFCEEHQSGQTTHDDQMNEP